MNLAAEIAEARDRLALLERRAQQATCAELGHDMSLCHGYRSAGCGDGCQCSVPVNYCLRCGGCDYGDNEEAREVLAQFEDREAHQSPDAGTIGGDE